MDTNVIKFPGTDKHKLALSDNELDLMCYLCRKLIKERNLFRAYGGKVTEEKHSDETILMLYQKILLML